MRKILILSVTILTLFTCAAADDYRVEPLCASGKGVEKCPKGGVDFIFPPKSNLKFDGKDLREKYHYHFVKITKLSSDYRQSRIAIENAEYYYSKKLNGEEPGPFENCDDLSFCGISYSAGKDTVVIRVDYLTGLNPLDGSVDNFNKMSMVLLKELFKIGNASWAKSIPQNIVEKVFELIPSPSDASLARYIAQTDEEKSYVLLNPKIILRVDTVAKDQSATNWNFRLVGTVNIRINRNNDGLITQNPFFQNGDTARPDNKIIKESPIILQASTGDIQFSETLRGRPYIFFYQRNLKLNNKNSSTGDGCESKDEERSVSCNSQLWHFDDLTSFYIPNSEVMKNGYKDPEAGKREIKVKGLNPDLDLDKAKYFSSFGFRNLINPMIEISLDEHLDQVPLGSNLRQLRNQTAVPTSMKFYRIWRGDYYRLKGNDLGNLILLPNDKITF